MDDTEARGAENGGIEALATRVRRAGRRLGAAPAAVRTAVLERFAERLAEREAEILAANRADLEAARREGLAAPLLQRLGLGADKLATLREGVRTLARERDPVGRVRRRTELDTGLVLEQVTSPIGVLLVIFESRPDAAVQIGALTVRSGNGLLLKGGREARRSVAVLVGCLREALAETGCEDAVAAVEQRAEVAQLLALDDHIDLVIPRGSGALVRSIASRTRIPVLGHAEGVCHLYIDRAAQPAMAERLAVDGKLDYPAACNATETLLVHRDWLGHWPALARALQRRGVTLRCDAESAAGLEGVERATEQDWRAEYGAPVLAVRMVGSLEEAIEHIHRHGSGHTEAICTDDPDAAERFLREVDAACVFHNASTRFADGYRFGLGAEVGIATGRIHARGPVGVDGLLTTRWLLRGSGQGAGAYGPGRRAFTHRPLPTGD